MTIYKKLQINSVNFVVFRWQESERSLTYVKQLGRRDTVGNV